MSATDFFDFMAPTCYGVELERKINKERFGKFRLFGEQQKKE